MKREEILENLKRTLKPSRYAHILGVEETALCLARRFCLDPNKASLAALLHDCAKYLSGDEMLALAQEAGIPITPLQEKTPELLHPMVGAYLAQTVYEVKDPDVLSAIACHLQGKEDMSPLDMLINAADYIEPNRNFPGVDTLRKAAKEETLPRLLYLCMKGTILHLLSRELSIDPTSIQTMNALLMQFDQPMENQKI